MNIFYWFPFIRISKFILLYFNLGTFDWCKNCASISDFYQGMGKYRHCGIALSSAEKVLKNVFKKIKESEDTENLLISESEVLELQAEINKKFVKLDGILIKNAVEAINAKKEAILCGDTWTSSLPEDEGDIKIDIHNSMVVEDIDSNGIAEKSVQSIPSVQALSQHPLGTQVSLFSGCPVDDIPYLRLGEIDVFDKARKVFLRATVRIEDAKKVFLLDGTFLIFSYLFLNLITKITENMVLLFTFF